jgi:hypothetical protein
MLDTICISAIGLDDGCCQAISGGRHKDAHQGRGLAYGHTKPHKAKGSGGGSMGAGFGSTIQQINIAFNLIFGSNNVLINGQGNAIPALPSA